MPHQSMHGYTPTSGQGQLWPVGDLQGSSDSLEQWRKSSKEHGGAADRSHYTHNPNLPHHPLLHQRNWEDGAQPAVKTRQAESRKCGGEMFGLS